MTDAIKGSYQEAVKSTTAAVSGALSAEDKWFVAGLAVRAYFGTEAAIQEVKAQFTADAIIPAMKKKHAEALAVDLPRKGSKDYNALDASGVARWEAANQAKKDARATAATMFARIVKYAFPSESDPAAPRTLTLRVLASGRPIRACTASRSLTSRRAMLTIVPSHSWVIAQGCAVMASSTRLLIGGPFAGQQKSGGPALS